MKSRPSADRERHEIDRQVRLRAAERLRAEALTVALAKLEGSPVQIKGADSTPAPVIREHPAPTEESVQLEPTKQPARKPYEDANGRQIRPRTRREEQERSDELMDAIALKRWDHYVELCQRDADENESMELARQRRMAKELRTGVREMPDRRTHCSLDEAIQRGYVNPGGDE